MDGIFDDVTTLLCDGPACWVTFTEPVALRYEEMNATAYGLYHYLVDLHVFWVDEYGPSVLIIVPGAPADSTWYYTRDEDLNVVFMDVWADTTKLIRELYEKDKDLDAA